jgi:hypothetical protein
VIDTMSPSDHIESAEKNLRLYFDQAVKRNDTSGEQVLLISIVECLLAIAKKLDDEILVHTSAA